jgi:hypothetical protein
MYSIPLRSRTATGVVMHRWLVQQLLAGLVCAG